jgi:hypothetical protein
LHAYPVDLLVFPARLLARPATAWLDVPGATAQQRRAQLIAEMTGYRTKDDLVDRQLIRCAVWALLFVFAVLPMITIGVTLELILGGDGGVAAQIPWGVLFFLFWMAALTGLKMGLAALLPAHRWHPRRAVDRALLLAQTPDVVLALIITIGSLVLIG